MPAALLEFLRSIFDDVLVAESVASRTKLSSGFFRVPRGHPDGILHQKARGTKYAHSVFRGRTIRIGIWVTYREAKLVGTLKVVVLYNSF